LLEGKLGILALLNEECLVPRGSDQNFLNKTINQCKTHPCFPTTNSSTTTLVGSASHHVNRDEFTVLHYAGRVSYHASGFLERNRDAVPFELSQLMGVSSNSVVRDSYAGGGVASTPMQQSTPGAPGNASPAPGAGGARRPMMNRTMSGLHAPAAPAADSTKRSSFMKAETVTTKFKGQLERLMQEITITVPIPILNDAVSIYHMFIHFSKIRMFNTCGVSSQTV
jgi:myosin-5